MNSYTTYTVFQNKIKKNLIAYKNIDNKSKICAVVKANAYGIGTINVVPKIESLVDCFAVANFQEAKSASQYTSKPIIILNFVPEDTIFECAKNGFQISVSNFSQLLQIKKYSKEKAVGIHLAVDTGMHRIGFDSCEKFEKALKFIKNSKNIEIKGIFSHIFNAKNKQDTQKQNQIFEKYLQILSQYFDISKITKHLLASESAIKYPEYRYDMVRLGIVLYANFDGKEQFCDAVQIKSKIVGIKEVNIGESVGYNKKFIAKQKTKIATIPLGYADGILRSYAKKGYVLFKDKFCKIVGNICMDMFAVDITGIDAKVGDAVTIIGADKKHKISLNQIAKWQNTICYEVLTNIKQNRLNLVLKIN